MKHYLFFVVFILFLSLRAVSAQTPTPSYVQSYVQTVDCGMASNPKMNKCCYTRMPATQVPNTGNILFDEVFKFINGLKDGILTPALESLFTEVVRPVDIPCYEGVPSTPGQIGSSNCICLPNPGKSNLDALANLCDKASGSGVGYCKSCLSGGGVWTGIGCIQADIQSFIQDTLLRTGIGIAGGISLLCIMFAAFQMQTSAGNAEKLKKAQELLTNCITGLMVIIFSTLILKIIGVDILRIPGFK